MGGEGKHDKGIEMSSSVRNFYEANDLKHVSDQLNALGVRSTKDLLIVDDDDLSEAGLRRLDVKRFKAGVQNMRDAATAAASDVEQKNDQDDTVTTTAAAAGEKAEEKNTQDDADADTTNVAEE